MVGFLLSSDDWSQTGMSSNRQKNGAELEKAATCQPTKIFEFDSVVKYGEKAQTSAMCPLCLSEWVMEKNLVSHRHATQAWEGEH